jgi:beta-N-acetylhexosaminidase
VSRRERREIQELRRVTETRRGRDRTIRRRRLAALGVLVAVAALIVVGVAIAISSGSGSNGARYVPHGVGSASTITPPPATGRTATVAQAPRFTPAPEATRLADGMTLAQQVAQLFLVSFDGAAGGAAASTALGSAPWGGVVFESSNFVSDAQVTALSASVRTHLRALGAVAPLLAAAQAGGSASAFPDLPPASQAAVGASGQPSLAYSQALAAGRALRRLGILMTIAPYLDVDNVGGALSGELFSSDPGAVARFGMAALGGYAQAGVIAAAAHFPGEGGASADPDLMTATVGGSLAALRLRDLIPFVAASSKAPVVVMSNASYVAFDGVTPASLLPAAVKLLRDQLHFGGVVMSDDLDATLQPTGQSPAAVAVEALRAGDDLLYISGPASEHAAAFDGVLAAAQHSAADRALVHRALLRDLTLKAHFGLVH